MRVVRIDDYIDEHEHFHSARKTLSDAEPIAPHTHDCFELFLVEQGVVDHVINGSREELNRGSLVFIRPHDQHSVRKVGDKPSRLLNVMFRPATADHLGSRYSDELGERFFWSKARWPDHHQLTGPRIERAINTALELQNEFRTLARIEEFLLTVITRVVDYTPTANERIPDWLQAACLEARDPFVLREGASGFVRIAGRGHEHVCRSTKKYLGVTPSAFMNRLRMEQAAMLLKRSSSSVPDIAEQCGIDNPSYFHRLFREHYGRTPLAYRKSIRPTAR